MVKDETSPIEHLFARVLEAEDRGVPLDRDALLQQHPEHSESLRSLFAAHELIRSAAERDSPTLAPRQDGSSESTLHPRADSTKQIETTVEPIAADDPTVAPTESATSEATTVGYLDRYFGDYELLEEIARGGMGVVFKARQLNLNRMVALKMILAGQLAGEEDVRRFYTEAEAAANLDHPGIVPIFEIGEHRGQHFFSMGYIEGESLAHKVAEGPLPPREGAQLVKKICDAMAYAHQRGVIHRDLKPANVLIDSLGQPKVTDFGLAKKTEADDKLTGTGQILGTPAYMPPEQASGMTEVGPLADVYSLGAILYCLLTGRPPFQAANPMDTLLQVLDKEPPSPRDLNPAIPADLETICLKSLAKEPRARYAGAAELGSELERYLRGEPILARPLSKVERGWRWCKRNPAVASLAATACTLLIVGTGVSSFFAWQARTQASAAKVAEQDATRNAAQAREKEKVAVDALEAEMEAKLQARRAIDNYVNLVTDEEILADRRFQPLRRRLLEDAEQYYRQMIEQTSELGEADSELASALSRLASIHQSSGSSAAARSTAEKSIEVLRKLLAQSPDDAFIQNNLAATYNQLGLILQTQSMGDEALQCYHEAFTLRRDLVDRYPENEEYLYGLATDHNNLGELQRRLGQTAEAEESYRAAIELKEQLTQLAPKNESFLNSLGNSYNNLGLLQFQYLRQPEAALVSWRDAIEVRKRLHEDAPRDPVYTKNLGDSYFNLGNLHEQWSNDPQAALEHFDLALQLHEQLVEEYANDVTFRFAVAKDLMNSSGVLASMERTSEAGQRLKRSIEVHRQLLADEPLVTRFALGLAQCHSQLAALHRASNEFEQASKWMREEIRGLERLTSQHPEELAFIKQLSFAYYRLGDMMLNQLEDRRSAVEYWRKEAELREELAKRNPDNVVYHVYLGGNLNNVAMVEEQLDRVALAAALYEQAVESQLAALRIEPSNPQAEMFLGKHFRGLSRTRRLLGEYERAVEVARQMINQWPNDPERLFEAAVELAACAKASQSEVSPVDADSGEKSGSSDYQEQSMAALQQSIDAGFNDFERIRDEGAFDVLNGDPEFARLLER